MKTNPHVNSSSAYVWFLTQLRMNVPNWGRNQNGLWHRIEAAIVEITQRDGGRYRDV